jgi:hypothetical protein
LFSQMTSTDSPPPGGIFQYTYPCSLHRVLAKCIAGK